MKTFPLQHDRNMRNENDFLQIKSGEINLVKFRGVERNIPI